MFGGMERPPASEVREIADLPEFSWKYEGIFKVVLNGNGSHSDNISTLEVACPKTAAEFRNTDQRKPTNFTLYPEGAVGTVAQLAWHICELISGNKFYRRRLRVSLAQTTQGAR